MALKKKYSESEPDYIMELTLETGDVMTVEAYEGTYFEDDMPAGRYEYFTRHLDCNLAEPFSIKKNMGLTVNFWGTIVTDRQIDFGGKDEIEIFNLIEI